MNLTKETFKDSKKNGAPTGPNRRIVTTASLLKKATIDKGAEASLESKLARTRLEVEVVNLATISTWKLPGCQRPLSVSSKVRMLAEKILHNGGEIPGTITIGVCKGVKYLLDGQHRCHCYRIAVDTLGMKDEGIVEVRYRFFDDEEQMGPEFAELNTPLVRMRPDDFLKALENSLAPIQYLRGHAPFVGYGAVRRGKNPSTCISMSVVLRMWRGSMADTPINFSMSAQDLARGFTMAEAKECSDFLNVCMEAFGKEPEYARLWSPLNLILCAWLYRRIVVDKAKAKSNATTANGRNAFTLLNRDEFVQCLMSLSAKPEYLSWLVGRTITDFDRGPCYERIKRYIQARIKQEIRGKQAKLPDPEWASSKAINRRSK